MKRAIFFVLASVIEASLFSQNLVINPDFELWGRNGKPSGWSNTTGCSKDSTVVIKGSYSCKQLASTATRDLGQKFQIKPATKYILSIFYNTDTTETGNGCRIWCTWQDSLQVTIEDTKSLPYLHSTFLKSNVWKQYITEITSPDTAGYFYLLVRTMPNSITYWDNFVFEEAVLTSRAEELLTGIKVYPNPSSNYLIISNLYDMQHIDIQNLAGMVVWSGDFTGEMTVTIPVSELRNGLYILRITASGKQFTRKFIKLTN